MADPSPETTTQAQQQKQQQEEALAAAKGGEDAALSSLRKEVEETRELVMLSKVSERTDGWSRQQQCPGARAPDGA